jgi:ribonuclease J
MKVCIHRGSHQIGGTCIEIESKGSRIVLDIGLPLDASADDALMPAVRGFVEPDPSLLAVVISHPHADHYGLAHRIAPGTQLVIGGAAQHILEAASLFVPSALTFGNVAHLADRQPMKIGPFTITPYLADHSAYDAYLILVEADEKRLFYSGDFRGHGRKGKLLERAIAHPPRDVDVLMLEGTTLGRDDAAAPQSEAELQQKFEREFAKTCGLTFVWCSSQNIDRVVTIYKAARHARKQLIADMYTACILKATGNPRIPQPGYTGFRVFLPRNQKRMVIRKALFETAKAFAPYRIYPERLAPEASKSVMLFRPSLITDIEAADCLKDSQMIYSMWNGYLSDERQRPFLDWLSLHQIPMTQCHTSGHACLGDLKRFATAINAKAVVPVHTVQPELYAECFQRVSVRDDGEWWEV